MSRDVPEAIGTLVGSPRTASTHSYVFEMLLDVTPQMPVFVAGFEPTLLSFYTVRFSVSASHRLRSADRLRRRKHPRA
jgi:hypothetical protein